MRVRSAACRTMVVRARHNRITRSNLEDRYASARRERECISEDAGEPLRDVAAPEQLSERPMGREGRPTLNHSLSAGVVNKRLRTPPKGRARPLVPLTPI